MKENEKAQAEPKINKHQDIYYTPIFEWYKSKKYSSEEYVNGVWIYTKSKTAYNYTITKKTACFQFIYSIVKLDYEFFDDQFNEFEYITSLIYDKINEIMNSKEHSKDQLIKINEPTIIIVDDTITCKADIEYIKDYNI